MLRILASEIYTWKGKVSTSLTKVTFLLAIILILCLFWFFDRVKNATIHIKHTYMWLCHNLTRLSRDNSACKGFNPYKRTSYVVPWCALYIQITYIHNFFTRIAIRQNRKFIWYRYKMSLWKNIHKNWILDIFDNILLLYYWSLFF